jgi:hypothetical protein
MSSCRSVPEAYPCARIGCAPIPPGELDHLLAGLMSACELDYLLAATFGFWEQILPPPSATAGSLQGVVAIDDR